MGKRIYEIIKLLLVSIIEVLLPKPRFCNGCGRQLRSDSQYQLCLVCATYMHRYNYAGIQNFNVSIGDQNVIKMFVACNYDELAKELVYKIKYKDKRECAITIAAYMEKAIEGNENYDYIVPVPISKSKLRKRGYNHVSLIAQELSNLINIPVNECLGRIKDTKPQVLFNEQERWYNVKGCFICNSKLDNLHILLIDDLITTGATVYYCSAELKKAGVAEVTALAFARSVRF